MTGYDPYSWQVQDDPYPAYAWLREHAPVYRNEERDFWAVSRHEEVLAALRNPALYSSASGVTLDPSSRGPQARAVQFFLSMDPPEHTRMRGLVAAAFTQRRITALGPRIRELARGRLQPLQDRRGTAFDFIAEFAAMLPVDVICELTGVPAAGRAEVHAAAGQMIHREDGTEEMTPAAVSAAAWLAGYFTDLVARLRRRPGPDLTSVLIHAQPATGGLSDGQIIACLFLLLLAGAESTARLLGNAWYQGHLNPAARHAGLNGRAADWVTETLRHDSPGQMMARTLTTPAVLHGTDVPAGARVALLLGSANRDGTVFADPGRFDLDRADHARAIPFGHGPHYCLGAALARLEARIALEELGAVITDYEIDMAAARRSRSPHLRGHTSLPCSVTPRGRGRPAGG